MTSIQSTFNYNKLFSTGAVFLLTIVLLPLSACAQNSRDTDSTDSARGAPSLNPATRELLVPGAAAAPSGFMGNMASQLSGENVVGPLFFDSGDLFGMIREPTEVIAASNGAVPEGVTPLEVDIFSSTDFYQDEEYWTDPRYYRCNSPFGIEQQRVATTGISSATIGDNPPLSAAWGHCDRDYPREAILSPYGFDTAEAHYQALMDEAVARGGPTEHDYTTVPGEWTGVYPGNFDILFSNWYGMVYSQTATIASLLTDEYRTRYVQQSYHQSTTAAAQWTAMYCWPEGFMRRWHWAATTEHTLIATPDIVSIMTSQADNFITNIYVGKEFDTSGVVPRLGADVPRWYGETIGFWDEDVLVTWTSNIQGWMSHSAFEFSNKMQTIEIYAPQYDNNGLFRGLTHEAIFYDPEALLEPVRIFRFLAKTSDVENASPFVFTECIQTIFPVDGRATPVQPGSVIEMRVPDMYDRPWAEVWDEYFEQDMQKPEEEDIFSF